MSDTATHTKVDRYPILLPSSYKGGADVPVELLHYIIELLADMLSGDSQPKLKDGMQTISLVSKRFRAIALPYLFPSISLNNVTSERCSGLAQILSDHRRVSRRVRNVEYEVHDEDGDEKLRSSLKTNINAFKNLPMVESVIINDACKHKMNTDDISSITWLPLLQSYLQYGSLTSVALCGVVNPPILDILRAPNLANLVLGGCLPRGQSWELAQAENIPESKIKGVIIHGQSPYQCTDVDGFPIFKIMQGAMRVRSLTISGKIDFKLSVSHEVAAKWFEELVRLDITTDNEEQTNEVPWEALYGPPRDDGLVMFPAVKTFNLAFERPPSLTLRPLLSHMPSLETVELSYPNRVFRFHMPYYIKQTTTPNLKNLVLQWEMPARSNWDHYYGGVEQVNETNLNVLDEEDDGLQGSETVYLQPMINYAIIHLFLLSLNSLETLKIVLHFEVLKPKRTEAEDSKEAEDDNTSILPACHAITTKMEDFIVLMPHFFLFPALRTVCVDIRMKIPSEAKDEKDSVMEMMKSQLEYEDSARGFELDLKTKVFWDED